MIWFLVGVVLVLSLVYLVMMEIREENEPPGVRGFRSVLVAIKSLRARDGPLSIQAALKRQYGDIVQLTFPTGRRTVFLGNHQLLREAFSKIELADRPQFITAKNHGLVIVNGRTWREQRRFALTTLRDFGMGKSVQEDLILYECEDLLRQFAKHEDSFDPKFYLGCAVTNVICASIFSDRFEYGDPTMTEFLDMITINLSAPKRRLTVMVPFLKYLPSFKAERALIDRNRASIAKTVKKYVEKHRESYQEGNIRDYIDAYIAVQNKEKEEDDSTFTDMQLTESVQDLFVAGSETTGTTLRWGLALMAQNSEVQNKVFQEIMNIIGKDRLPNMNDKVKMPYTEAVLLEIQRYGSVVPVVAHKAASNCTVGNYQIKEGSTVMVSILALNRDERVWQYPHEFNVDNFYKDGEVINRNNFVAFSIGKRSCLGESLAKMETFLFFVALVQKFEFFFGKGEEPDLTDPDMGLIRMPKAYKIRIKTRD